MVGTAQLLLPLFVPSNIDLVATCVAGTDHACAVQIGRAVATPLAASVERHAKPLRAFLATASGGATFHALWKVNREALPAVQAELEGLAEGAGISLRDAIISSLATELSWFARHNGFDVAAGKHCTDYHALAKRGVRAWVHNEDGEAQDMHETFLVDANASGVRRVSYVYAHDLIGGWAWSVNSLGVAQSVNALFPSNYTLGIGAAWLARHVANATSLDDAAQRACGETALTSAGGQNFNLGSIHEPERQLMIEVSNQGCDVRTLTAPTDDDDDDALTVGFHTNAYESSKLKNIDGGAGPSSSHRMDRMRAMPPAGSTAALEAVVSDTHDALYPIHRRPTMWDPFETLNSVLFDVASQTVRVWGTTAPTVAGQPTLEIDWKTLETTTTKTSPAAAPAAPATPTIPMRGIGNTTLSMPLVGLGTWRMGNDTETSSNVALALGLGYRALDCALGYNNQLGVGAAIAAAGVPRSELWVTSKIPGGLNASATTAALDESVDQLGVAYVDLMLLHFPASWSGVGGPAMRKEQWLALEAWAKSTGKAKAIGVSHYCKRHLMDIFSVATEPVALNQVQYHVGMGPTWGVNASLRHDPAFMEAHGVVCAAYSSLCGPCPAPDNMELITGPLVTKIGKAHGVSGPRVALRWAVQRNIPVVPRSTSAKHLSENLDLFSWSLSEDDMAALDAATTPVETGTPPQPHDDAQDCLVP